MVDFVEEVEEQLRAERYSRLARVYLPWFGAAIAAAVLGWLGVWGFRAWQDRDVSAASVTYDKGITALASGDASGAYADFGPVAKDGPPAYRALALMQQANIRFAANKPEEAIALYDAAAKAAPSPVIGDLAALRAAQVALDTAPLAQIQTRLNPLMGPKQPYTLEAKELLALAKLQAGQLQQARGDFNALTLTLGVSQGMRGRAANAIALIDSGQAGLVGPVVKAAANLPPFIQPQMQGPPDGPPSGGAPAPDSGPAAAPAQPPTGNS